MTIKSWNILSLSFNLALIGDVRMFQSRNERSTNKKFFFSSNSKLFLWKRARAIKMRVELWISLLARGVFRGKGTSWMPRAFSTTPFRCNKIDQFDYIFLSSIIFWYFQFPHKSSSFSIIINLSIIWLNKYNKNIEEKKNNKNWTFKL